MRPQHGIGDWLAHRLSQATGAEARATVLGHVQRGAMPTAEDRLLASALGVRAVDLLADGKADRMVAWWNRQVIDVPLEKVVGRSRTVDPRRRPDPHRAGARDLPGRHRLTGRRPDAGGLVRLLRAIGADFVEIEFPQKSLQELVADIVGAMQFDESAARRPDAGQTQGALPVHGHARASRVVHCRRLGQRAGKLGAHRLDDEGRQLVVLAQPIDLGHAACAIFTRASCSSPVPSGSVRPSNPSRRSTKGRLKPCTTSVVTMTAKVRNTIRARSGKGLPSGPAQRQRHGHRQRHDTAQADIGDQGHVPPRRRRIALAQPRTEERAEGTSWGRPTARAPRSSPG